MTLPFALVDAFAVLDEDTGRPRPRIGNPAAVVVLSDERHAAWMQATAAELNAPATAFVLRRAAADGESGAAFDLRWFTARVELKLCGHGTLAAAHVLWENGIVPGSTEPRFHTASGPLAAARRGQWIELDFPASPPAAADMPAGLLEALGLSMSHVRFAGRGPLDFLIELRDEAGLRALTPDFARLRAVPTRGVIVTSPTTLAGTDFVSRFFAPSVGLDEDAATGSAHCCLGPYWAARLGKTAMKGRRLSERGATITVDVRGDRIRIAGQAVTVAQGELLQATE